MYKELNIKNWTRLNQYKFFKEYDNPFFNICANVDVTKLKKITEKRKISFFIASLFLSQKTVNHIKEFKYRMKDDSVIIYDTIHAGSTILNDDETFSFCYFDFSDDFETFSNNANKIIKQNSQNKKKLEDRANQPDMIHYSVIPWIEFTSISHPRKFGTDDSIPKIVFGKYFKKDERLIMPVSISAHHSLMDGIHVGKYFDYFQKLLDKPDLRMVSLS